MDGFCKHLGCGGLCPDDHAYCCNCGDTVIFNVEMLDEDGRLNVGCFPATSVINLENGKLVTMSELQVGDKVKTGKMSQSLLIVTYTSVCVGGGGGRVGVRLCVYELNSCFHSLNESLIIVQYI